MKTRIILLLSVVLFVCSPLAGQIKVSSSNNVGIGCSTPDPYKIWLINRDYNILIGGTTGSNDVTGAHIMRIFTNAGRVFTINSYTNNYPQQPVNNQNWNQL